MLPDLENAEKPNILIVDDDEAIRLVGRLTLKQWDFNVLDAGDGLQAVSILSDRKPDLILLDVRMPGMDGIEVCRQLRKMPGGERIPVLMITGLEDLDSIMSSYEAGATDFMMKPINWTILNHRIKYMLRASQTFNFLIRSETKNRALLNAIPDAMFQLDRSGVFLDLRNIDPLDLQVDPHMLLGLKISDALPEELAIRIEGAMEECFSNGIPQLFEYHTARMNTERYFEVRMAICGKREVLVIMRDITERKHTENNIRYLAYHDSLTRLPNIQLFKDHLGRALTAAGHTGRHVAVLFVDLDRFKQVNDTLGHKIGDLLLQATAERIINGMRRSDIIAHVGNKDIDNMVARMGGDEFTILLPDINKPEDVAKVSGRILEELSRPFLLAEQELNITASIGIALYPNDGEDIDNLINNADTAMYHAKVKGRNNFQFFDESMNLHIKERLDLENLIRNALDKQQFVLHYLPRYEFSSGQIYGVEALLRWNPTDILNIPVEQVIAIAGDIRIISRLREWILRTACNQAAEWQRKSLKCCVSVNVSLHEFRNTDLILEIRNLIEETGLEPCHLDLEITESVIMQDVDAAAGILKNLQRLGVGIAIDDFGIGYSSINFLRRFPIKQLKIAQVLMKDVTNDADSAAVINAVIALAHSLNIKAVGEGVETEEQYRFLQEHGCDEFQGFLYGKPMPADEITRILIKQKKEL